MKGTTVLSFALLALVAHSLAQESPFDLRPGAFLGVANRGSGTVTLINDVTEELITIPINGGDSEPMYFSFDVINDQAWVGDRKNSKIYVFRVEDLAPDAMPIAEVDVPAGVFHMYSNGKQLWVCSDVDNFITVIKLDTYQVLRSIDLSTVLPFGIADDFKCHDTMCDLQGHTFVSMLAKDPSTPNGDIGYIVSFDTVTLDMLRTVETCGDPHLYHSQEGLALSPFVWSACQRPGRLLQYDLGLDLLNSEDFDGAHGLFGDHKDRTVASANIESSDGVGALRIFPVGDPDAFFIGNTQLPNPHNLAFSGANNKLFITYSGPRSEVEIVDLDPTTGDFVGTSRVVTVGVNPFGIMFIPFVISDLNPMFLVTGLALVDAADGTILANLDLSSPSTSVTLRRGVRTKLLVTQVANPVDVAFFVLTERTAGFNFVSTEQYESFVFQPLEGEVYIQMISRSLANLDVIGGQVDHKLIVQFEPADFFCAAPIVEDDGSCNCDALFPCTRTGPNEIHCATDAWYCVFLSDAPDSLLVEWQDRMCTCTL